MSSFRIPSLTAEQASYICMTRCQAGCCRGPLLLELTAAEVADFQQRAVAAGISANITRRPDGSGWLRFADHPGECCPMLDRDTFACRIYANRPGRCRRFPQSKTPGCAISGG